MSGKPTITVISTDPLEVRVTKNKRYVSLASALGTLKKKYPKVVWAKKGGGFVEDSVP